MTIHKEGKGVAMIRRRKAKHSQNEKDQVRSSCPVSPISTDEEREVDEEKEGYIFDNEVLGPLIVQQIMSSEKTILLGLIAFRICNSLFIQTAFVPDEYWQSLEVAHKITFGYGYTTWEWREGIRSYIYPTVFAALFKFLALFGLDNRLMLIKLPRILQGIMAAYGDLYLFKLSCKLSDRATAQWTLLCQILSWFTLYSCTRTLSNCVETVLVTMALYYYPWPTFRNSTRSMSKFVALAVFSVMIRPTAAVIWILMCSWHLQNVKDQPYKAIKQYLVVGSVCFLVSTFLDCAYHGDWIIVHYNFLLFNVAQGGGSFYGTHPWHWYITQGYPLIMGTMLIPFIMGAYRARNKVLLFLIMWTIFCYSFFAHKEHRFIMPVLPLSMHYCGVYFQYFCKKPRLKKNKVPKSSENLSEGETTSTADSVYSSSESLTSSSEGYANQGRDIRDDDPGINMETKIQDSNNSEGGQGENSKTESKSLNEDEKTNDSDFSTKQFDKDPNSTIHPAILQQKQHKQSLSRAKIFVLFLVLTNVPVALYFGLIHQRGTVTVMKFLYDQSMEKEVDITFLMPCHSTPYYSYLHRNVSLRFLTCEPNLKKIKDYTDEAEIFYRDPQQWLNKEYKTSRLQLPSHLVYFDTLKKEISEFLVQGGYKDCGYFFNTHFPEGRVGSYIWVSCR